MEELVPILIFFVIILVGGLKKLLQYLAQQAAATKGQKGQYEAAPDDVREFLEQISVRRRAEAGRQVVRAETKAPEILGAPIVLEPVEAQAPRPREVPAPRPIEEGPERAQPETALGPQPPPPQPRRQRPRRRRARREKAAPAPAPEQPREAPAAKVRAVAGLTAGTWDLRKAIIWSEILGRPIGLRRRLGHRPQAFRE